MHQYVYEYVFMIYTCVCEVYAIITKIDNFAEIFFVFFFSFFFRLHYFCCFFFYDKRMHLDFMSAPVRLPMFAE